MNPEAAVAVRASQGDEQSQAPTPYCQRTGKPWEIGSACVAVSLAGGVATGVLSGLLGVGGGFVIVPLLTMVAGLSMRQAVASSLLIISMVSASGFFSYCYFNGSVDVWLLAKVAFGGVLGMLLGGRLINRIDSVLLQKVFAVMLILVLPVMWLKA
jgi:uncharacterized membrane protein YfcA